MFLIETLIFLNFKLFPGIVLSKKIATRPATKGDVLNNTVITLKDKNLSNSRIDVRKSFSQNPFQSRTQRYGRQRRT